MGRESPKNKARKLYESGFGSIAKVAEDIGVHKNTINGWKREDKEKGKEWIKPKKTNVQKCAEKCTNANFITQISNQYNLSNQQTEFAIYYGNGNSVQSSCLKAGYSKSYSLGRGWNLLENVGIKQIIEYIKKLRYESLMYNEKDVLNQYIRIAQGDLGDYFDSTGEQIKEFSEVDTGIIKEYQVDIKPDGTKQVKFKLESKHPALKSLGEYFGMFKKEMDLNVNADVTNTNIDSIKTTMSKLKGVKR